MLKYIVFFMTLLFAVPIGAYLGSRYQIFKRIILYLVVLFTCRMSETINFISHEFYRGTTRGFEIALVDLLILTLFFIVILTKKLRELKFVPLGTTLYFFFFSFSLLSIFNSGIVLYSFFEITKLIRMFFFLWVMTNFLDSREKLEWLFQGIQITVAYIFLVVLYDKYILGMFQAKGPFPHQNSMVMYSIIFGSIIYTRFLFSKGKDYFINGMLIAMNSIVIISSLSRAGMAFYFMAMLIITGVKLVKSFEKKDLISIFVGTLAAGAILLKAGDSIIERFQTAPKESKEVRIMLAKAAVKMANDKMFGVGINNFGLKINYPYPYSKGTPHYYDKDFRGGLVETAYLMVAAETGWHNLAVYLLLLFWLYFHNILNLFKAKVLEMKVYSIALSGGLLAIYLESTLEWVLRQTTNFYQLMLIFAVINCIRICQKSPKLRQKRRVQKV